MAIQLEIMKTNRNSDPERTEAGAPFIAAHLFIKAVGISHTTFWRWCKAGRFNPVNINGRKYLDQAEVARFWAEAKGGKYAEESNLSERPPHE